MSAYNFSIHPENIIISQAEDLYSDPIMEEEGASVSSDLNGG